MRGMIKWKPFNTLLNSNDIKSIEYSMNLINKPIIMEDRINSINSSIIESLNNKLLVEIKHWNKGLLKLEIGYIKEANKYKKYILINNKRIYFKNIINIKIID